MAKIFPKTASSQQVQRHYRTLFNYVIDSKEPLIILNNNNPEVVIIDIDSYQQMKSKVEQYEQELARYAIESYQNEKENNELKNLKSLSKLNHESE